MNDEKPASPFFCDTKMNRCLSWLLAIGSLPGMVIRILSDVSPFGRCFASVVCVPWFQSRLSYSVCSMVPKFGDSKAFCLEAIASFLCSPLAPPFSSSSTFNHTRSALLSLLLCCLAIASACADGFDAPPVRKAKALHDAAVATDAQQAAKAYEEIAALAAAYPDNQILQAYLGSILTIRSGKAFLGPAKLRYLKTGLETMDKAVTAAPHSIEVRLIRAINNLELPAFLDRRTTARSDFRWLLEKTSSPSASQHHSPATLQAICYFAGHALKQEGQDQQAIATWQKGLKLLPQGPLAKQITQELQKK